MEGGVGLSMGQGANLCLHPGQAWPRQAGAAHTHRGAYLTSTKLRALYHLSHNLGRKMRLRELKKQSEATQN